VVAPPADGGDAGQGTYYNTTDPTNKSAAYVGADACRTCHPGISRQHSIHGHAHKLTRVQGAAPTFPEEGTRAGVPDPPDGYDWTDISYVIGGYTRKARFIDNDGYVLTTGVTGVATQWNLALPANGSAESFINYEPSATEPKPYDFSCFVCHTTGARAQDEDFPEYQENRPGFIGTWEEPGVQCEACHGPGSKHIPNPSARDIFVGTTASECGRCHTRGDDPSVILSKAGYIQHHEQWPELLASGGHADFTCTVCHDPHVSANYDRFDAIRNECSACHETQNLALHSGKTYRRGGYAEEVTCVSCHMPYATKSASSAPSEVVGETGRMGDTKTHIFRINPSAVSPTDMFTQDGNSVLKDSAGRAGVSLDFVCLRCHNDIGNAPGFSSLTILSDVATRIHSKEESGVGKLVGDRAVEKTALGGSEE
jgi:hypothetical protein